MDTRFLLRPRAPYASDPTLSRGRRVAEPASATRTEFQRDRDRILHSAAFRRLQHKTQVFFDEHDYHRTRLTHTLEVAQISRSIGRALGLDEDLCEALALAHDLGHTPFGHAGERALHACMAPFGGFDHNLQSLRVVTRLERRYAGFDGLNLTWETLEGLAKHNGPVADGASRDRIAELVGGMDLRLDAQAGPEAQVAALSDDIAYDSHDLDDGLRAGLFTLGDLEGLGSLRELLAIVRGLGLDGDRHRSANELVRRLMSRFVEDVIAESGRRIAELGADCADDVRGAGGPVIAFSPAMQAADREVKAFLFPRMYRDREVMRAATHGGEAVQALFSRYCAQPEEMPADWCAAARSLPPPGKARLVADFIAGMTDRFALAEHRRLFDGAARMG